MSIWKSFIPRLAVFVSLCVMLQGCDFVRAIAGRPTSEDLTAARESIRQERLREMEERERRERMRADSMALVRDSLLADSLARSGALKMKMMSSLSHPPVQPQDFRYCIMMGYFHNGVNARRLADRISADGYSPRMILFGDGATAVGVFPSGNVHDVVAGLDSVRTRDYFPDDCWVVFNDLK